MLDIKDLEAGKRYRHVAGELGSNFKFLGDTFTVSIIDADGDVWTEDATHLGDTMFDGEGWCITDVTGNKMTTSGILKFEEVV